MSDIPKKPKIRTLGEFVALYHSASPGDPTLPVPRDNQFYGFLSLLRQCKLNVDNHLTSMIEFNIDIRLNEKALANITDKALRHLIAYDAFDHLDIAHDKYYNGVPVYSEDFDDLDDVVKNLKISVVVFSWDFGWPIKSEKDEETASSTDNSDES